MTSLNIKNEGWQVSRYECYSVMVLRRYSVQYSVLQCYGVTVL